MARIVAFIGLVLLLWAPSVAHAQRPVQLEYLIGINCILPARAAVSVDVPLGVPVTLIGNACGTTPITGAAQLTFSSSDPRALLPPSFRFLPGTNAVLGQVTFNTPGPQTLTVQDVPNAIVGVSYQRPNVVFTSPTLALFVGYGCPLAPVALSTVTVGTPVTILGYECPSVPIQAINLTFTSSDPRAILPPPLVFPGGQGTVLGSVTFLTPGLQNVRASDAALGINALGAINVLALSPTVPVNAAWALLALVAALGVVGGVGALRNRF
jgi:hypothetical protein